MTNTENNFSKLQEMYKNSSHHVRKTKLDIDEAQKKYSGLVNFVSSFAQEGDSVLDVGCGSGWSSYFLSQKNFKVTGCDLHSAGFEPAISENLSYIQGDALNLPFHDESFNVVVIYECLEHVPNPEKALHEMIRVTKTGGLIIVVGPNLLSLGLSLKAMFKYVWEQKNKKRILFRDDDLPFHPLGNTLPENLYYFLRNIFLILSKMISKRPSFVMRTPDLRPPFHADSDSCYLLNPIDLKKFIQCKNYEIIQSGANNRNKLLEPIAAGTWFCARKTTTVFITPD